MRSLGSVEYWNRLVCKEGSHCPLFDCSWSAWLMGPMVSLINQTSVPGVVCRHRKVSHAYLQIMEQEHSAKLKAIFSSQSRQSRPKCEVHGRTQHANMLLFKSKFTPSHHTHRGSRKRVIELWRCMSSGFEGCEGANRRGNIERNSSRGRCKSRTGRESQWRLVCSPCDGVCGRHTQSLGDQFPDLKPRNQIRPPKRRNRLLEI